MASLLMWIESHGRRNKMDSGIQAEVVYYLGKLVVGFVLELGLRRHTEDHIINDFVNFSVIHTVLLVSHSKQSLIIQNKAQVFTFCHGMQPENRIIRAYGWFIV